MADIPNDVTTTATISVGGSTTGALEVSGDHDWYKISLTAGQAITVALNGVTLQDPYLKVYDQNGVLVYQNDDINTGVNLNSLLSFAANYTGIYYIDAGSYEDAQTPGGTGDYQLNVTAWTQPPVWTNDQIAQQLTTGYWGDGMHRFTLDQAKTITVNVTGLDLNGQNLALTALQQWSSITGITFTQTSGPAQITFTDDDPDGGAFTESIYSGADITSSHVNIDAGWLTTYGSNVGSYSYQAYLHEVGHALGLGHAGNYNTTATYPYDALYQNDAWSTSVMSYFSQTESTYFADQGFDVAHLVTPMVADILAIQQLYGLSTNSRSGDTTYGFNSNAGNPYNTAVLFNVAFTIFDTGGTDTMDYSGYDVAQRIDLNSEAFSNIGGLVGNVTIARGTVIENAIGGSGNDTILGNSIANIIRGNGGADTLYGLGGNDTLSGGNGNDFLYGGLGNDTYRVDQAGDRVIEAVGEGADIVKATVSFALASGSAVEQLRAFNTSSTTAINLSGNEFGQAIIGNAGSNILRGYGGNDTLSGGLGNDFLYGGLGNDTFRVDQAGDRVIEAAGEGYDTVKATVSFALEAGSEIEQLRAYATASTTALNLTGNEFGQAIIGNAADNILRGFGGDDTLSGGGGNDTLYGGTGDDTYRVDQRDDRVIEAVGDGRDIIRATVSFAITAGSEVEELRVYDTSSTTVVNLYGNEFGQKLVGNDGSNLIRGFAGNDRLYGHGGNDQLDGGTGNNMLTGGAGVDRFIFSSLGVHDSITDFTTGEKIDLRGIDADAALSGDQAFDWIGGDAFSGTAGELRAYVVGGVNYVAGDVNGDGVADFFINVGTHQLVSTDILF